MDKTTEYLLRRLSEASSYAGLAALLNALSHHDFVGFLEAFCGIVAFFTPETWKDGKVD